ncbi:protein of unknown function [Magnetospirillum sp. XM-1]|nr:protein of unknown function [Magnetospirillum sp. XM-1]
MPGLVPGIHVTPSGIVAERSHVDGRVEPGHDEVTGCFLHEPPPQPSPGKAGGGGQG